MTTKAPFWLSGNFAPVAVEATQVAQKPSNAANALPPGALESALARAEARFALEAREGEA